MATHSGEAVESAEPSVEETPAHGADVRLKAKIDLVNAAKNGTLTKMRARHLAGNVAARALATYLIPGCVGTGVRLGSEGSSVGGGVGVGGVWKFAVQHIKKIKILKIQICSAQNVGKVWISRKKILPALFGAI